MKTTDHLGRPIIAVTGVGVVTALGEGITDNWAALSSGRSGIHRITRFPTEHLNTTIAGTVDFLPSSGKGAHALTRDLAECAATEAVAQSGLPAGDLGGPLFLGAPPVELDWRERFKLYASADPDDGVRGLLAAASKIDAADMEDAALFGSIADHLADRFGARGLPLTVSTACATGATVIQLGVEAIRRGDCDRALAIGADGSATAEALIRFSLLSALSTNNADPEKASKPFSKDRDGFVLSEGSAALVLESLESATARGATVLGIIRGCGDRADDFHRTRSKPDGSPAIAAVRAAIGDAGISEDEIDYINAHGTSTPLGDEIELGAVERLVGNAAAKLSMSSTKSAIGHLLGAAGAVEAIFSLLAIRDQVAPPTLNLENPSVETEIDLVPHVARKRQIDTILTNSFGFGGTNASLIMRRVDA